MSEAERKYSDEELLKMRVDLLFSKYSEPDPGHDLETICKYFNYLSENIFPRRLKITGDKSLMVGFESVSLLLQERLLLYPETIRKQVEEIIKESKLGTILATVVNLPEEELHYARIAERYGVFGVFILSVVGIKIRLAKEDFGLTRENLFNAKLALSRLAQIVKYASTIEVVDYDASFYELRNHYNPDLIQKSKVVALINILRVSVDTLPDKQIGQIILEKLDRLEKEVRKPKPRWGIILAGALALLGFLADLKGLFPDVYSDSYRTAAQIVAVLYQDGSVLATKSKTLLLSTASSDSPKNNSPPPQNTPDEIVIDLPQKKDEE